MESYIREGQEDGMSDNVENEPIESEEPPEFKTEYFWAFMVLLLYKTGGVEVISLEHLEQFDFENDCPQVSWDAKNKAIVMRNLDTEKPVEIITPGKIRKKMFREFVKQHLT